MPLEPPVSHAFSTIAMRTTSPNRNVTSTKYLPASRSTIGPTAAASAAAAAVPAARPAGQGRPSRVMTSTDPWAPSAMKAAWPRLTCPVRMMRCSEAAAIAVMQMSTPTWCRNLSSVSQGQPRSAAVQTTAISARPRMSGLRRAQDAPRAHDQQHDHHAEGKERRGCRAVERADEAFGQAENETAERGAGDRAHAAKDHHDEGHHQRPLAQERRYRVDLPPQRAGERRQQDGDEKGRPVGAPGIDPLRLGDLDVLRGRPHGEPGAGVADEQVEAGERRDRDDHDDEAVDRQDDVAEREHLVGDRRHVALVDVPYQHAANISIMLSPSSPIMLSN